MSRGAPAQTSGNECSIHESCQKVKHSPQSYSGAMDSSIVYNKLTELRNLIKEGKAAEAIRGFAALAEAAPDNPNVMINGPIILIDGGLDIGDEDTIQEGIRLCEVALERLDQESPHHQSVLYNMATGYGNLWSVKCRKGIPMGPPYSDLQNEKGILTNLLDTDKLRSALRKQVTLNLANCFDHLGRSLEAIEYYDDVLHTDPEFPLALGNKALALASFAKVTGKHQQRLLLEATQMLQDALGQEDALLETGGPTAVQTFKKRLSWLARSLKGARVRSISGKRGVRFYSKTETEYARFCGDNRLFLNVCLRCTDCKIAFEDPVFFDSIRVSLAESESRFKGLANYFNQIKEDYATARWLLFQSRHERPMVDRVSTLTRYADTLEYARFDLYVGTLKTAFEEAADILDKVAGFINVYFRLSIKPTHVWFKRIWYAGKNKHIRSPIKKRYAQNQSLRGLYDIHWDLDRTERFGHLRELRNALTHRCVVVHDIIKVEPHYDDNQVYHIYIDDLDKAAVKMLRLARSAVVYLASMVHMEEERFRAGNDGIVPSMPFFFGQVPEDRLKSKKRKN